MRESKVEREVCSYAQSLGWDNVKLQTGNGDPDRLFFRGREYPIIGTQLETVLVEFKQLNKKAEPHQQQRHALWRKAGAQVHTIDNVAFGKQLFDTLT